MSSSNKKIPQERVISYIDGFNLYYGLKSANYRRYYWLDPAALCRKLIRSNQSLVYTKYFTARVSGPTKNDPVHRHADIEATRKRQTLFLDALDTLLDFSTIEGHYLPKTRACRQCNHQWQHHEEKMTDVNIATEMLCDAFADQFDVALVVSGDSDLSPPIRAIRQHFPSKRVVVAFPPNRSSQQLKRSAHTHFTIARTRLRDSQLPDQVKGKNGATLSRPAEWK